MFILINNTAVPVLNIIDVRLLPAKRGYCRLPLRRVDSLKDVVTPEQEMWIRDHVGRGHSSDEEMYLASTNPEFIVLEVRYRDYGKEGVARIQALYKEEERQEAENKQKEIMWMISEILGSINMKKITL